MGQLQCKTSCLQLVPYQIKTHRLTNFVPKECRQKSWNSYRARFLVFCGFYDSCSKIDRKIIKTGHCRSCSFGGLWPPLPDPITIPRNVRWIAHQKKKPLDKLFRVLIHVVGMFLTFGITCIFFWIVPSLRCLYEALWWRRQDADGTLKCYVSRWPC